jgi:hypothetical protein
VDEFTDDVALDAGGWDRRFARVLAKAAVGAAAIAIIDSNGGGGDAPVYENIDAYTWESGVGWEGWVSSGGLSSGWAGNLAYASGTGTPGQRVVVEYRNQRHHTHVESTGYWLVVIEEPDPGDGYPVQIAT